jgi:hypothetical protein
LNVLNGLNDFNGLPPCSYQLSCYFLRAFLASSPFAPAEPLTSDLFSFLASSLYSFLAFQLYRLLASWLFSLLASYFLLEAAGGIEPPKKVLQTLALATWLRRHERLGLESLEARKLGCQKTPKEGGEDA